MTQLDSLGGALTAANAINSDGRVAGYSVTLNAYPHHACVWDKNGSHALHDLGTLGGVWS